jgi:hypothetical protein
LLLADLPDLSGVTIGAYAFDAYERAYGPDDPSVQLGSILTADGQAALPKMVPLCLLTQQKELHEIAAPLVGGFVSADPTTTEPWASLLQENTPGGAPIGVPILVAQGEADQLVRPDTTTDFVGRICGQGEVVDLRLYPDIDHGLVAERAIPLLIPWLADRLAGKPAPTTCSTSIETTTGTSVPGSTPPGSAPVG